MHPSSRRAPKKKLCLHGGFRFAGLGELPVSREDVGFLPREDFFHGRHPRLPQLCGPSLSGGAERAGRSLSGNTSHERAGRGGAGMVLEIQGGGTDREPGAI